MKPKCLITLELPDDIRAPLEQRYEVLTWPGPERLSEQVLGELLSATEGLLCALSKPISASLLNSAKALKVVSTISVGVDHIDLAAATRKGIAVGHTPGVLVDSTADLALALMLGVTRRVAEADRWIRGANWTQGWQSDLLLGTDLSQAKVGVVGLGPIGQAVVKRLAGFGARVLVWNRTYRPVEGAEWVELDALFAESDIVTLHTALTEDTQHIASRARLAMMPDRAVLINTGRGPLVDESALLDELSSARLRAGLDVFQVEPLPIDHPFLSLDNVVLLPHVGSATAATRHAMVARALGNLHAGIAGERVPFCANPEVYRVSASAR
ncbi:MAG: D-glycerate dehydrogenase [Luminiphilus sp.]|nr:D-glycerate dehydrogenase [Luminiphilus sp.]